MRLGLNGRNFYFTDYHKSKKIKRCFVFLLIFCFFVFIAYVFFNRIYPNYVNRAEIQAHNIAVQTINKCTKETLEENNYQNFSIIDKDNDGNVISVESQTVKINKFKTDVISKIQKNISSMSGEYVYIPIGSLLNKEIFSGMGPNIKVKILPLATVDGEFSDEFISCGINQIKHKITLDICVNMTLVSATMHKNITVTSSLPISETLISADVPGYYGNGIISADKNNLH